MADFDPVLYDFPLNLRQEFFPLGFPLSIATNSERVLQAAAESWQNFSRRFPAPPLQLRIGVCGEAAGPSPFVPKVRAQGNLISFIGDAANFVIGDFATGFSYGWVTDATSRDSGFFRYHYLDALILTLIDMRFAAAMHCACVEIDGKGVLLCGDSGAGKSSFAYACARRGWGYLTDDASCLLFDRADRTVVGNPHRLRLRPDARRLFPELSHRLEARRANGKDSIELATADEPLIRRIAEVQVRYIVFLDRTEAAPPRFTPFASERALAELAKTMVIGGPDHRAMRAGHYRNLLQVPVHRLQYSNLDAAVEALAAMMEKTD